MTYLLQGFAISQIILSCISLIRMPWKYHWLDDFKNRNLFSHSSRGQKTEVRVPAWSGPFENFLPGQHRANFLCPHLSKRERERERERARSLVSLPIRAWYSVEAPDARHLNLFLLLFSHSVVSNSSVALWTIICQVLLSISQARILEWVAAFFFRYLPDPRMKPVSPA